ncbi:hypothetical protein [Streptomyces sp. NPDC088785]|uniref:hypothetical protein n=1 Tax=Streptomyces sp. NPDC088785 TaxID=3365897 RepID=UPI0038169162
MGLDVEVHAARPARGWGASRGTLLRGSSGHGDALADVIDSLRLLGAGGRLAAVDPYGDALMNEQEAAVALDEIPGLRGLCADEHQRAAVDDLAAALAACAGTPGSCLWFQGD